MRDLNEAFPMVLRTKMTQSNQLNLVTEIVISSLPALSKNKIKQQQQQQQQQKHPFLLREVEMERIYTHFLISKKQFGGETNSSAWFPIKNSANCSYKTDIKVNSLNFTIRAFTVRMPLFSRRSPDYCPNFVNITGVP